MAKQAKYRATILVAVTLLAASAQPEVDTYVRKQNSNVEHAYFVPGADFSKYTRLMTDGLEIYYPQSDAAPPAADIARIREMFRSAFTDAIGGDYEFVDTAGPDVLKVKAQLIDMKVTGAGGDYTPTGKLKSLVASGQLTFLMEMIDSESGEVLARAGDRTWNMSSGGAAAEWAEVDRAAKYWAGLFRTWLDESLGEENQD